MRERMQKGKGQRLMRNRGAEIEAVFGQLKQNDRLRRLVMRGRHMVHLEVGLKAIAHNLRKMAAALLLPNMPRIATASDYALAG